MALKTINGQSIDFLASRQINRCGEGGKGRLAALTDSVTFQIGVSTPTGAQLINDPDINNTASDWTTGTGWSISAGKAVALDATGALSNTWVTRAGAYYKAVINITTYGGGEMWIGSSKVTIDSNVMGNYDVYFVGDGTAFNITTNVGGRLTVSIESINVYELSSLGWRIVDCSAPATVYEDYTNTDNRVSYLEKGDVAGTLYPQIFFSALWGDFTGVVSGGCYRIELIDMFGNPDNPAAIQSSLISDCFNTGTHSGSLLLTWTNNDDVITGDGQLLNYTDFSYTQYLRIHGKLQNPVWKHSLKQYKFSNGDKTTAHDIVFEKIELEVLGLLEDEFRALSFGLAHDNFYIDGIKHYLAQDSIEPRWRRNKDYANDTIELERVWNAMENSFCDFSGLSSGNDWTVEILFNTGHDTATITWKQSGTFIAESTDGTSTFTYDGSSFAAWSKTVSQGTSTTIVRSVTTTTETLTLTGNTD